MFQTWLQLHKFLDVSVTNDRIDTELMELEIMNFFKNFLTPKIVCKLYNAFFTVDVLDGFWFAVTNFH